MNSVFVWPAEGANPPSAFPFSPLLRHSRRRTRPWALGGCFPSLREAGKQGGFRGDLAGEKIMKKSSNGPLLFLDYYGIIVSFLERERPAKRRETKTENERMTTMNTMMTNGAQAIAEDLENLGEEIANDTEMTLTETKPEDFDHYEWKALREAIKAMREKLDEMEEMIDRAETEADEYDEETAEDRYETYWE